MKHLLRLLSLCLLMGLVFASCEKPSVSEEGGDESGVVNGDIQVRFRVAQIEQIPFGDSADGTRTTPIGELCQRISFGIYQNGKVLKTVHEKIGDENFGQVTLSLEAGSYQVVIVAHNGEENAQINNPEEVTFKESNHLKVTDTFYYYDTIKVTKDCNVDVKMKRAVAMVKIITKDTIPDWVTQVLFNYTGGSSTLNATTGKGCKASRQAERRYISEEMIGEYGTFYIYTFPHEEEGTLKLHVAALDKSQQQLKEYDWEVPVTRNQITQYTGYFFSDGSGDEPLDTISGGNEAHGNAAFLLMTDDDEWNLKELTF